MRNLGMLPKLKSMHLYGGDWSWRGWEGTSLTSLTLQGDLPYGLLLPFNERFPFVDRCKKLRSLCLMNLCWADCLHQISATQPPLHTLLLHNFVPSAATISQVLCFTELEHLALEVDQLSLPFPFQSFSTLQKLRIFGIYPSSSTTESVDSPIPRDDDLGWLQGLPERLCVLNFFALPVDRRTVGERLRDANTAANSVANVGTKRALRE